MKLLVKRQQITEDGGKGLTSGTASITEIPGGTITWLSIIYIFVNVVATSISGYIGASSQRINDSRNFELREQNFRLQLLQRVLEVEDPKDREASLNLLLAAGLFNDDNKKLKEFLDSNSVPRWPQRSLEALSTFLTTGVSASGPTVPSASVPNSPLPGSTPNPTPPSPTETKQ